MVPAPTRISGTSSAIARIASSAASVRRVSSIAGRPPATRARAMATPSSAEFATTTGSTGTTSSKLGNADLPAGGGDAREHTGAGVGGADGGAERREQLAAGPRPLRALRGPAGDGPGLQLGGLDVQLEAPRGRVERDQVA